MNTLDPSRSPVSAAAVPLDLPATRVALEVVGRRLVGLLEAVPDPQAPTRGLAWTLGETSLHLAGGPARYADFARGRALPEPTIDLGPVFAQRMAAEPERAPSELARRLEANLRRYLAETAELPATHQVPFFGGVTIELAAQSAILLGEFVVHGLDVARSLGRPWPIEAAHARLIVAAVTALLPRYVDRERAAGLSATYQVRLRGGPS
ncbi:MAG TPA: maleylpyruvate isomerase family mycothiol-dependent enzyme, partial [Actinomycetes bacterium]|nr:maleylpyruvate isomerase family mycothiol-dependent enzyme [Actinomycetes bacterium]